MQLLTTADDILKPFDDELQLMLSSSTPVNLLTQCSTESSCINLRIMAFEAQLTNGESSDEVSVDSGVTQGTVLGLLLFLCHINHLPDCSLSPVVFTPFFNPATYSFRFRFYATVI